MSNLEEDDGYDSIDEDAELELSCALHDLALRVKTFEEDMKDRFHRADGDCDEEITEDIPKMDDAQSPHHHSACRSRSEASERRLGFPGAEGGVERDAAEHRALAAGHQNRAKALESHDHELPIDDNNQ